MLQAVFVHSVGVGIAYAMRGARHYSVCTVIQADMMILKVDMNEIKAVHAKRKERQSGKRLSFKDRSLLTSEDIAKAVEASEKATKAKKKVATKNPTPYFMWFSPVKTGLTYGGPDSVPSHTMRN